MGASSSVSTTDGASRSDVSISDGDDMRDVGTIEVDRSEDLAGSGKLTYPLVDSSSALCATGQKPKLRVANAKSNLNLGPDPISGIVHLNQWKIHKLGWL
uniref:Uncharacterized protein n=1 Tax=Solanum tuberosum TaxID=4113 RepID=M1DHT6_SOLTU